MSVKLGYRWLLMLLAGTLACAGVAVPCSAATVQTAMGPVVVPDHPIRIVSLSNDATEALYTLGLQPLGATAALNGEPWSPTLQQVMAHGQVLVLGLEANPDLERIASLQPDLILGTRLRQGRQYRLLSMIAPTVLTDDNRKHWRANFTLYAQAAGQSVLASQQLMAIDQCVTQMRTQLAGQSRHMVSVLRFNPGQVRMYQRDSFSGEVLDMVGLQRPKAQQKMAYGITNFSRERMAELDADVMIYFTYGSRRQTSTLQYRYDFMRDPAWQQLRVVRQQHVYPVDDGVWNTANGPLAVSQALADLVRIFHLSSQELTACRSVVSSSPQVTPGTPFFTN